MTNPDSTPPRSWMQISIRGLLLLTTLVAVFFGWRQWSQGPGRRQQAAIQELYGRASIEMGEMVEPDWQETWLGIMRPRRVRSLAVDYPSSHELQCAVDLRPESLSVHSVDMTPEVIDQISQIAQLEHLHLAWSAPAGGALRALSRLPRLKEVSIRQSTFYPAQLAELRDLPHLKSLRLAGEFLMDHDVAALSGCQRLENLELDGEHLTSRSLTRLHDLPALESLQVSFDSDDVGVAALARFPNLTSLPWRELAHLSDAALTVLWRCRRLKAVHLGPGSVTDDGIAALGRLENLETLTLRGIDVTDEGLRTIARMPKLWQLLLEDINVTDAGLAHLRSMPQLKELTVRRTRITLDHFCALSKSRPTHVCFLEESGFYLIGPRPERIPAPRSGYDE